MKKFSTIKICYVALLTAINIAFSSFGIPVPGGHLYLNDVVIVFAGLCLDPLSAFIVGGIGAFIGDLLFYPAPMFVSLVTRGAQAVVISLIVKNKQSLSRQITGCSLGALVNLAGYSLGRAFIYSTHEYALVKLPFQILMALLGALGIVLYQVPSIRNQVDKIR